MLLASEAQNTGYDLNDFLHSPKYGTSSEPFYVPRGIRALSLPETPLRQAAIDTKHTSSSSTPLPTAST